MSTLFDIAFYVTIPFWALMIVLPTWTWTERVMSSPWIVLPPLTIWAIAAAPRMGPLLDLVTAPSLAAISRLSTDEGVLIYLWAQIIAWDLFIGRWIYLDSRRRSIHPLLMAPVLIFTILLSPIGLPFYLLIRSIATRRHAAPEPDELQVIR